MKRCLPVSFIIQPLCRQMGGIDRGRRKGDNASELRDDMILIADAMKDLM